MAEIVLGKAVDFHSFPMKIEVEQMSFYLLKDQDQFTLVSRICPHMGYPVEIGENSLVCHLHGWTFDIQTGRCREISNECLKCHLVKEINGELVVFL